jgi:AcrR family transcriptional regulator
VARNSEKTKAAILDAVGSILAREGFGGIGINAVAREAGVDKVLIYRYFGGLPQLLDAFAQKGDYWPSIGQILGKKITEMGDAGLGEVSSGILKGYLRELRKRVTTQEIMRWELVQKNELTDKLAAVREAQGMEILGLLPIDAKTAQDIDLPAIAALLHAGLVYLLLRSKTADVYMGVDLKSKAGWSRIERVLEDLIRSHMKHIEQHRDDAL